MSKHKWHFTCSLSAFLILLPGSSMGQFWEKLTNRKMTIPVSYPPQIVLKGVTRVAVMDFKGECGAEVTERLTDVVSRSQKYELVDRSNLENIMGEQAFQQSESVSADSVAKLGKMLGAAALVTGRVTRCGVRTGPVVRRGEPFKSQGRVLQNYTITTTATVNGSFQLLDVTTGKVLARRPIQVDHGVTNSGQASYYAAPNLLPPDEEQVRSAGYGEIAADFSRMILGWTEPVEVLVYDDNKWNLKASAEQLKVGDLRGAAETLRASIEANALAPNADPKLASKAWYNLGIALMYSQHFDEAMEALQRSQATRSTDVAVQAMAECRKMVAAREETRRKEKAAVELGATKAAPNHQAAAHERGHREHGKGEAAGGGHPGQDQKLELHLRRQPAGPGEAQDGRSHRQRVGRHHGTREMTP